MVRAIKIICIPVGLLIVSSMPTASAYAIYAMHSDNIVLIKSDTLQSLSDSIRTFYADDYPVTDEMLNEYRGSKSSDIVWLTNRGLKQTLVFELYTDLHRLVTYHFISDDVPDAVLKRIQLYTNEDEKSSLNDKRNYLKSKVNTATDIEIDYFTTNKGFQLGDHKDQPISLYGEPDQTTIEGDLEILEWRFDGDILYDGKTDLKGKTLAKDSFGHDVIMFFRQDALIAMILFNDIP